MERKSVIIAWAKVVLPVFLILPLVFVPMDLGFGIAFYIPAVLLVIYSLISIPVSLLRSIVKKKLYVRELLGAVLIITAYYVVNLAHKYSIGTAKQFVDEAAASIEFSCRENGECPDKIEHWSKDNFTMAGWLTKYPIIYRLADNKKSFHMTLRINIDSTYIAEAGVDVPLNAKMYY